MRVLAAALSLAACLYGQDASLEGVAVHALTGQPLRGVHLQLLSMGQRGVEAAYGAISDRAGHLSISPIPAGAYIYTADLPGFVVTKGKVQSAFTSLSLKPGERVTDFRLEMVPQSVVAGRVIDEFADPLQGFTVQLIATSQMEGMPAPNTVESTQTDDRGEFRLVTRPGKYHVKVTPLRRSSFGPPEIRDGVPATAYTISYYPGSLTPEQAGIVEVAPGDVVRGLEIRMSKQRGFAISGVVSGVPEGKSAIVSLRFGPNEKQLNDSQAALVGRDGKYQFSGLAPGHFVISASTTSPDALISPPVSQQLDRDIALNLTVSAGGEIAGKLDLPPGMELKRRVVLLQSLGPMGMAGGTPSVTAQADGSFTLKGVMPGKFRVSVTGLPENAFLKAIQLDDAIAADTDIDLSHFADHAKLKITVSPNGGQLNGFLLDSNGSRVAQTVASVFLVRPGASVRGGTINVRANADGSYQFKGLRPGKYRLVAVDLFRSGAASFEAFDKPAQKATNEIEIKEGDRLNKDIVVSDAESGDAKKKN